MGPRHIRGSVDCTEIRQAEKTQSTDSAATRAERRSIQTTAKEKDDR